MPATKTKKAARAKKVLSNSPARAKAAAAHAPESRPHRDTRAAHKHERAEDYVEAIAHLIKERGEARATDLARALGVSHVTVVRTVARLQREGLLTTQPYRSIFLTPQGTALALQARERHHLVLDYLLALGVPPAIAQSDAEGIEHHVSPHTLAAFQRHLCRLSKK